MKNALKITCPNCQKEFDAGSAFNAHFEKNKLENEKNLKKAQNEADKYKIQAKNSDKEITKAFTDPTIPSYMNYLLIKKNYVEIY